MKRLFQINVTRGDVKYFETKMEAQEFRSNLLAKEGVMRNIHRGPDHWKEHPELVAVRERRQKEESKKGLVNKLKRSK